MTDVKQLITEHLNIWLTAETEKKSGRGRSSGANTSIYGVQKLRELILELAVTGKLVKNICYNQTAEELISQIKIGHFKSDIKYKNPNPKDLPKGWAWALIDEIAESNIGLTYSPKDVTPNGTPVLRSSNIQNGKIDLQDLVRVNTPIKDNLWVQENDLLICARNGSKRLVGKTAKITGLNEPMSFGAFMAILRSPLNDYLEIFLNSPLFRKELDSVETTTINQITQKNLKNTVVPIPPKEIQMAIVEKVDELMQLCDQLEQQQNLSTEAHEQLVDVLLNALTSSADADEFQQNWQRISANFDLLFTTEYSIEQLKQTILQLAVMGKLVKQDPNDEPASELLKQIAEEKAKLVKEGKIKKSKPLPEITDNEKPLELPSGWEWSRLGDICQIISGNAFSSENFTDQKTSLKAVKITNIGVGEFIASNDYLNLELDDKIKNFQIFEGDLLLALTRPYISTGLKICRCPNSYDKALLNQRVCMIRSYDSRILNYVYLFLRSNFVLDLYKKRFSDSGLQPNLKMEDVSNLVIPIPSLKEQKLILDKILILKDFLHKLNVLNSKLQNTKLHLADVLVANAVEGA